MFFIRQMLNGAYSSPIHLSRLLVKVMVLKVTGIVGFNCILLADTSLKIGREGGGGGGGGLCMSASYLHKRDKN